MAMSQFCGHQFLEVGHKNEISIVKEVHAKHTQTRTPAHTGLVFECTFFLTPSQVCKFARLSERTVKL